MKKTIELVTKGLILSTILYSGVATAETVVDDDQKVTGNITVEKRVYQHDGYGAQWALDTGSDGLWFVPKNDIEGSYSAPLKVRNDAAADTLVIGTNDDTNVTNGYVGIGTDTPTSKLDVLFSGDAPTNDDPVLKGLMNLITISSNNTDASKTSDVSFALKNARENFKWNFRTFAPGEGFLATKEGTGGGEFRIDNTTNDFTNTKMVVGGVTVFENGHVVTASSRELKRDIKPLDTQAALDAFHKLQPVSYEYKAQKGEPVVGFIAEDIPELVAMPSRKSLDSTEIVAVLTSVLAETRVEMEAMKAEIAELKALK